MPCLSPGSSVMSIALVRVAEVPMQECFKRRERPADARFPFVDDLFGLVEFQQPDMFLDSRPTSASEKCPEDRLPCGSG